jgi:MinD superfamily P-loop ATPase
VYTATLRKKEDMTMPKKVTKASRKVRLYVWEDVLRDYTPGIACAAARSVEEARTAILTACEAKNDQNTISALAGQLLVNEPKVFNVPAGAYVWGGS